MNNNSLNLPKIGEKQLQLLEKLSNACSVSGDESAVRRIVRQEIKGLADNCQTDSLGNLSAVKKARKADPIRILISAHMDEVGFMLVEKEEEGIFRFRVVGGIDPRMLAGKPVLVGKDSRPGLIGACPVHLTTAEQRKKVLEVDDLRIDTGPGTADQVHVGDYACFATRFQRMGKSVCGKAMDNRLGVATLIELLRNVPPHVELTAVFSVQEEVGLRGARVAAWDRHPDLAMAIDCTPANDLPAWDGSESSEYKTKLGKGPAIYTADGRTLNDPRLIRYLLHTAERYEIPCQLRQPAPGGTDAGALHLTQEGIPAISVSIPGRYAHSSASIVRIEDWEHHYQLISAALHDLDKDIIAADR